MARATGVPIYLADVIQGVALVSMVAGRLFAVYRLRVVRPPSPLAGEGRGGGKLQALRLASPSPAPPRKGEGNRRGGRRRRWTSSPPSSTSASSRRWSASRRRCILATLGELYSERSGVLNLGIEGIMLLGAMVGFTAAYFTGSLWLGVARRAC